eukprot:CFRG8172T1
MSSAVQQAVLPNDRETGQKLLYTPGPLNTSKAVKETMLLDWGSRDVYFINVVKNVRKVLLDIAGVNTDTHTCVPIQGAGTFAIESVISSAIPKPSSPGDKSGKMIIFSNGSYGDRMKAICDCHGIEYVFERTDERLPVSITRVRKVLEQHKDACMVATVHSETSSGLINDVSAMGAAVKDILPTGTRFFVDAMSSFGGIELNMVEAKIDFLVSSANKCLEGVPGFSYAICARDAIKECKGNARTVSLDLWAQNDGLEKTGQFRFTPATHAMIAFNQSLIEFEAEGGLNARYNRYKTNNDIVLKGMRALGFESFLKDQDQGPFITSFIYPSHKNFDFHVFYEKLNAKDLCIYPGKVTKADSFRIGNIGQLYPEDMHAVVAAVEVALNEMNIPLPLTK